MTKEELKEYLTNNLTLCSDTQTRSEYVGDMGSGDSLYKDYTTLTLILELEGEAISTQTIYIG